MQIVIFIIAGLYLFFLPGFFLSLIFFAWGTIDFIERLALSFALSLSTVTISIFYANLFTIPVTALTVMSAVACILFLAGLILLIQQWRAA